MAEFDYRAYGSDGREVRGTITAGDDARARDQLREQGLFPSDLTARDAPGALPQNVTIGTLPAAALADWATRLAAMLSGGLPLDRALDIVAGPDGKTAMTQASRQMLAAVQSGASPAEAAQSTGLFDNSVTGLLRASESTGDLAGAFSAIARDSAAAVERRRTIISALTYPVLLTGFAVVALTFMLLVIIPRFQPIFAQARVAIPPGTERILAASAWLQDNIIPVALIAAVTLVLAIWAGRMGRLRPLVSPIARRIPGVSGLYAKLNRVQVLDRMSGFLAAGVPLPDALTLTAGSTGDARFARALAATHARVTVGEPFSTAIAAQGIMGDDTLALVRTGEESGALQPMLALAASTQDAEAKATLKRLLSIVEPLLILLIGAMIGGMILSIFQAVLSINDVVI